ncbi:MAG: eL32 family ribosomal protein [Candidatus Altiarchaeota archaeon]
MKDFKDITPTEKKRETKIQKEKKLDKETKERKKKKPVKTEAEEKAIQAQEQAPETEKPTKTTEEIKAEAAKKEAKEKPEKKKPKPKPVEKIKYYTKKEVPELRLRKKKPKFRRQEHYKKRLDLVWRKPIGIDSKQHEGKRGKGAMPTIGYKNPNSIQNIHPMGYRPVLVHNLKEIAIIDAKTHGAIIASAVGRRKRNEMIKEANRLQIVVLNPRKGER